MDTRRKELGVLVRRERVRLQMRSQPALAEAAKISSRKVSDVERGKYAGPKTYDAIEVALRWPPGGIQAFLDGGPPPPPATAPDDEPAEPRKPVLSDAEIAAMDRISVRKHYFFLEKEYGEEEADDWLVHAAQVRRDARRAARGPLATDGV